MIDILGRTPHATTLRDLIVMRASYGDKPYLICRDETLTYADADRLSNKVANRLLAHGIGKGDVVATLMYNSLEQALIWFGCAKIGAIYASLNVSLVKDDMCYSLNDTGAKLLVVDEELAPAYNAAKPDLTGDPEVLVLGDVAAVPGPGTLPFSDLMGDDETLPDADVAAADAAVEVVHARGGEVGVVEPGGVLLLGEELAQLHARPAQQRDLHAVQRLDDGARALQRRGLGRYQPHALKLRPRRAR